MILLNEITIKNFLSHENTTISFKESVKLLVDGKSGSGKSSVAEAILWTLYGRSRSDNRSIIRRGSKTASVSLKLSEGQSVFNITRSVSSAGKNTLAVTKSVEGAPFTHIDRAGIKDIESWIENDFLKASYELFTNSIAYPQDNENSFVKATATKRKDLLLEIVRAGDLDVMYNKAKDVLTMEESNSAVALSKIGVLESDIKRWEEPASKVGEYAKAIDDLKIELDKNLAEKQTIDVVLTNLTTMKNQVREKETLLNRTKIDWAKKNETVSSNLEKIKNNLSVNIDAAKNNVSEAKSMTEEMVKIEIELKGNTELQSVINQHLVNKPQVHDYTSDIASLNKQLIPLIKDSSKCPAGDACPFTVPIKGQITFLSEQIQDRENKTASEKAAFDKWNLVYASLPKPVDTTELYKKWDAFKSQIRALSQSETVILMYEMGLKNNELMIAQNKTLKTEMDADNEIILTTQKAITELEAYIASNNMEVITQKVAELTDKLKSGLSLKERFIGYHATAVQAQDNLKQAQNELGALSKWTKASKERLDALQAIKEAFSPRGVKAVVIDYLVPQLEEKINEVLGKMSDFRIRLDTQQSKIDDEGMKEGLFITVINDRNEELSFDNYSGGEKVKITIAISEALASLMTSIGFRIMDENIVSLDRESTENFVYILSDLQQKFDQLLVISHLPEVKDIFSDKITVTKINGVSKIV